MNGSPYALPARRRRSSGLWGLIVPAAGLLVWEALSRRDAAHAYAFTPLLQIGRAFAASVASGELFAHTLASLGRASLGLLIGGAAGLLLGALMGAFRIADRVIGPLYHALRQVPLLGLAPLFALWFGSGDVAKLVVVALASFYPVTLATAEGLRNVERAHLEVARAFSWSRLQTFRFVMLPSAVPFIVTGLSQALAFTWIATVGSELLFSVGPGLGGFMEFGQSAGRMDVVVVGVATIALVGLAMNHLVAWAGQRLLRWRPQT